MRVGVTACNDARGSVRRCEPFAGTLASVLKEDAEVVVAELRARHLFAHVMHVGITRVGVRIVLPSGAEAIWDADGAAGLECQVMRDGVLVGFVPVIPGSADFTVSQTVDAIANAEYGEV
jgi:hypothetical protein